MCASSAGDNCERQRLWRFIIPSDRADEAARGVGQEELLHGEQPVQLPLVRAVRDEPPARDTVRRLQACKTSTFVRRDGFPTEMASMDWEVKYLARQTTRRLQAFKMLASDRRVGLATAMFNMDWEVKT